MDSPSIANDLDFRLRRRTARKNARKQLPEKCCPPSNLHHHSAIDTHDLVSDVIGLGCLSCVSRGQLHHWPSRVCRWRNGDVSSKADSIFQAAASARSSWPFDDEVENPNRSQYSANPFISFSLKWVAS